MTFDAIINRLFSDIRLSRADDTRLRCARRLREWVRMESRGGADTNFSSAMPLLFQRLSELCASGDAGEKIGGILAIYELTDEPMPDNETKILRFAVLLRNLVPATV